MISYLSGKLLSKKDKFVILEVNGVGYKVFLSQKTLLNLPPIGQKIEFFCFLDIGEKKMDLYGFLDEKELEFFEILNDIRGIGPKAAIEISSFGPLEKLKDKILNQDETIFDGIPGIGKKKAMSIILDLTGKIKMLGRKSTSKDEAESALIQLGFSKQQAKDALSRVPSNVKNTEERVRLALKNIK